MLRTLISSAGQGWAHSLHSVVNVTAPELNLTLSPDVKWVFWFMFSAILLCSGVVCFDMICCFCYVAMYFGIVYAHRKNEKQY